MQELITGVKQAFSPKRNWKELTEFNGKEYILMAFMVGASILSFYFGKDYSWLGWLGGITSVATGMSLILVDKGKLTNYMWGTVGSIAWLIVSLHNRLIGDIFSQVFYTVMQFVGIYVWYRSMNVAKEEKAESKKIPLWLGGLVTAGLVIGYFIIVYVSHSVNGNQIWLDATLLPLGIAGQVLMTFSYRSQWVVWILLDAINVYIWYVQFISGGVAAMSMFVLQIIMLVNAFYGAYCWYKEN
ncbi:nicotinamide riboside transporter [Lactobacillus phage Lbab1]|nr:nicotinamide riboside transporter [Lactobacillus phage Lbab1]